MTVSDQNINIFTQEPEHVLQLDLVHCHPRRLHWSADGGAAVRAAHRQGDHVHVQG